MQAIDRSSGRPDDDSDDYGSRLRRLRAKRDCLQSRNKTRSEDNCMTEFMKVEFINVNDKKNWHLRVQIILYRHLRS